MGSMKISEDLEYLRSDFGMYINDGDEATIRVNNDEIIPLALALLKESGAEVITVDSRWPDARTGDTVIILRGEK